jgi:hypothetical protein
MSKLAHNIKPINAGSMVNQNTAIEPVIRLNWNYDNLDKEEREAAIAATIRMKRTDAAAGELAWEIGRDLIEQKARVGHGRWLDWLATEMGYSDATAENLMRIYRTFPELGDLRKLGRSALTLLATTPPAVKEAVKEAVAAGATVTHKEIKTMKDAAILADLTPSQMTPKQVMEALTEWNAKGWKLYSNSDKYGAKMYRMVHETDQTATMEMNDPKGVLRVLRGTMHKSYAYFEQWRAQQAAAGAALAAAAEAKATAAAQSTTASRDTERVTVTHSNIHVATTPAPEPRSAQALTATGAIVNGTIVTAPPPEPEPESETPAPQKLLDFLHIDDACVDLMAMLEDCQDVGYPLAQAHNLIEQLSLLRKWLAKYAKSNQ